MTRGEYFGQNARTEHIRRMDHYADNATRCREDCQLCGIVPCFAAWRDSEVDDDDLDY